MCGICGYISKKEYSNELLNTMNDTMIHRGPDDFGVFTGRIHKDFFLGMAQRRLSIIDLSELGHQPMFTEDRSVGIVYNGEVYNFQEIRKELINKKYQFKSKSDTEVLLYAYKEYGLDFVKKLNGMFAFAIFDFEKNTMIIARDRMGKKPIYYYWNGNLIVFGSELKPILKHPEFRKKIRNEIISQYLTQKYIPAPDTIFEDTYKLRPGELLIWKDGEISFFKYWDIFEEYSKHKNSDELSYVEAKNRLKDLLYDSVSRRMIADVSVGTFLSAGIDSTLVSAIAKDISDNAIHTYTIGFDDKKINEAVFAKEIALYLGTKHDEIYVSKKKMLQLVKDIPKYYDEPFADSSQIPSMLVSEFAKSGVTVALSGDGGDEIFCGYTLYDWALLAQYFDRPSQIIYSICNTQVARKVGLLEKLPDKLYAVTINREKKEKVQCFEDIRQRHTRQMVLGDSLSVKFDSESDISDIPNWQVRRMLLDMKEGLPGDMLTKVDRASMKYSLEVRCPLLDYRIVEYSFSLPHNFKYKGKEKKYILKDILYDLVPQKLMDRPKQGFGVPLGTWLRNDLYDDLIKYSDKNKLEKQGIFCYEKIKEMISLMLISDKSVYSSLLWSFFVFQMWYQEYIEDLW